MLTTVHTQLVYNEVYVHLQCNGGPFRIRSIFQEEMFSLRTENNTDILAGVAHKAVFTKGIKIFSQLNTRSNE